MNSRARRLAAPMEPCDASKLGPSVGKTYATLLKYLLLETFVDLGRNPAPGLTLALVQRVVVLHYDHNDNGWDE
eukprot:6860858-Lingulodinium_polyedra.AAC.1